MNTHQQGVKGEGAAEARAERAGKAGREYRRPEVHDLGCLELVQGVLGPNDDGKANLGVYIRPIF
jgi:hypothetical protein